MARNDRLAAVAAVALVIVTAAGLRFWQLGAPDLVGGDEGYYGTYARNILAGGLDQLVNLGREPLSAPDNKPFLFPLLLAGSITVLGPTEWALRLVPALAGLVMVVTVGGLVRRSHGAAAAVWAAGLTLLLPPLVYASRVVMGEPLLTAFGLAGLWAAVIAVEEQRRSAALLAGALWGCGFLVKLWLVGLFMLPFGAALLASPDLRRRASSWRLSALAAAAFLVVGGAHLALVALVSRTTLHYWLEQYFVFSLLGRAAGGEFADYWHQPWTFYLRATLQTCFMVLPLAVLGAASSGRPPGDVSRLSGRVMWGVMALELLLLSAMEVKLRQYGFPLLPSLTALAGIGAAARLGGSAGRSPRWLAAVAGVALAAAVVAWQLGAAPLMPSDAVAAVAVVVLVGSAALLAPAPVRLRRWDRATGALLVAGTLATAAAVSAVTVARECLSHRTGYREAAAAIAPALADVDPTTPCFLAPEVPAFQFHLFRTGHYWRTPYLPAGPELLLERVAEPRWRAYVTTAQEDLYGGPTPPEVVEWAERNAVELTATVGTAAGHDIPIRVFIRSQEAGR